MKVLPDRETSGHQIAVSWYLSRLSTEENYLGYYEQHWWDSPEEKKIVNEFRHDLDIINNTIKSRNVVAEEYSYPYLLPEHIPNSIAL